MANIQIIQGDFEQKLKLQFAPGIKAGFPSPAEDYNHETLDFNRDLIQNPEATFYGKVEGDSMIEAGINDGDIAVIDRSIEAQDGDVVVGYINDEFLRCWYRATRASFACCPLCPSSGRRAKSSASAAAAASKSASAGPKANSPAPASRACSAMNVASWWMANCAPSLQKKDKLTISLSNESRTGRKYL